MGPNKSINMPTFYTLPMSQTETVKTSTELKAELEQVQASQKANLAGMVA